MNQDSGTLEDWIQIWFQNVFGRAANYSEIAANMCQIRVKIEEGLADPIREPMDLDEIEREVNEILDREAAESQ